MYKNKVILLLGSNLGAVEENLKTAIKMLEEFVEVEIQSEFLLNEAVEFESEKTFCNVAIGVKTGLSPMEMLIKVKEIEKKMGRLKDSTFTGGKYTDRLMDIDIVAYGNLVFESEKLNLPHKKHLFERNFSKKLLKDINFFSIFAK